MAEFEEVGVHIFFCPEGDHVHIAFESESHGLTLEMPADEFLAFAMSVATIAVQVRDRQRRN
jgi:hypothetical protein